MRADRWHALSVAETVRALATDGQAGLTSAVVRARRQRYGPNELSQQKRISPLVIFGKQFQDFMVLVLLGAAAISFLLQEWMDGAAVTVIVLLNGVFGFVQEYRAERSLEALRDMTSPTARVVRNGEESLVSAAELVPGDVILLFEGDRVPADGRLIEAQALAVDESVLTGESTPASKNPDALHKPTAATGDRTNMLFKGTPVTRGRGRLVVTATGMLTEIGQIAGMMDAVQTEPTPLQRRLAQLGHWIVIVCLVIVGIVFTLGVFQGLPVYKMFLTAVSLAVAAIPEGLPAVVTVSLAIGVQQMLRRRAIVRRLPAVETLGCATIICSDKTGTLTRNEMTVARLWTMESDVAVTGSGYVAEGEFSMDGRQIDPLHDECLRLAIRIGAVCNHARLQSLRSRSEWRVLGDPTEAALLVLAAKAGSDADKERKQIVAELPFDSYRKRMSVVVKSGPRLTVLAKGAPDLLLERCSFVRRGDKVRPLSAGDRQLILRATETMAHGALRVLALAYADHPAERLRDGIHGTSFGDKWEKDLTFVGLVGMIDPPRPAAKQALRTAEAAGIRTMMVTGDHPHTAAAIAKQLGIIADGERVVTGAELQRWTDEQWRHNVGRVGVFARVSPNHKLRIVRALRAQGEVVAMTGDGVNDAPAIKEADIGIAMGRTGTDVTREAADMILGDDNYATIIAAVEEGRGIYENIRKFMRYLLGCNVGEVLTMFTAALAGMPLPLLPMQILWMNLVTDGMPAIALGMDRPAADSMRRPPRAPQESIFSGGLHIKILARGVMIATCALIAFVIEMYMGGGSEERARTLAFTTLVVMQFIYVFQVRSERADSRGRISSRNVYLIAAVFVSSLLHLLVLYAAPLQTVFGVVALTIPDWLLIGWICLWYTVLERLHRVLRRALRRKFSPIGV